MFKKFRSRIKRGGNVDTNINMDSDIYAWHSLAVIRAETATETLYSMKA